MKKLTRLVYRSESNIDHGDAAGIEAIFRASVHNNVRNRITGALALPDGKFVQAIEGRQADVDDLMRRLRADDRHCDICVLGSWPIGARVFAGWAMARPDPTPLDDQDFRIVSEVGSGAEVTGILLNMVGGAPHRFF